MVVPETIIPKVDYNAFSSLVFREKVPVSESGNKTIALVSSRIESAFKQEESRAVPHAEKKPIEVRQGFLAHSLDKLTSMEKYTDEDLIAIRETDYGSLLDDRWKLRDALEVVEGITRSLDRKRADQETTTSNGLGDISVQEVARTQDTYVLYENVR